ncbi:MAG: hypothetical protein SFT90_06800, partial [Rickettsiales bacterium]|nr:hypothetical protein [Rickettsiales bacterium]
ISYNIEVFENAKIQNIFANSFYLAEKLEDYISKNHPSVKIFREAERLETGGGLINICNHIGYKNLFTMNSDIVFPNFLQNCPVKNLLSNWQENQFEALLLIAHRDNFFGYSGVGDYSLDAQNKPIKKPNNDYIYTGLQIINATILENFPKKIFSLSEIFNLCLAKNKLGVTIYHDKVLHIGDVEGLKLAENFINS